MFDVTTSTPKNLYFFNQSLILETYIIGYKSIGESILFLIKCDGVIRFSGLIDCYEMKCINKIVELLTENKIEFLNFICWTHPDIDHSRGIKNVVERYATKETNIWIPEGVDTADIKCSKEVQDFFKFLKQSITTATSMPYRVFSTSDKKDLLYYDSTAFQKDLDRYTLSIISYAPSSFTIRKQFYNKNFIPNDRSIFCILSLGKARLYFTGDIENSSINNIPDLLQEHIHILKIPHHGSNTSTGILKFIIDNCDVACSTAYRMGQSKLPEEMVMDQYSQYSKLLYCTSQRIKENNKFKYGIVKISTNILENTYTINLDGNASLWN